jgi:hypothetical protein
MSSWLSRKIIIFVSTPTSIMRLESSSCDNWALQISSEASKFNFLM